MVTIYLAADLPLKPPNHPWYLTPVFVILYYASTGSVFRHQCNA